MSVMIVLVVEYKILDRWVVGVWSWTARTALRSEINRAEPIYLFTRL